jgi:UDP-N-acetylmuramyl pentapeptide phosphotransferase/UDP-N-acetylglucosamine-1-phosphate transferase
VLYVLIFIISWIVLYLFYRYKTTSFYDIPNQRSMHTSPIKRGSGFFFSSVFLLALVYIYWFKGLKKDIFYVCFLGVSFFTSLGLLDDLYQLSAKKKLFFQSLFLFLLFYFFPLEIKIFQLKLTETWFFNIILSTIYILFVVNICNFMDGLDLYLTGSFYIFLINFLLIGFPYSNDFVYCLFLYAVSLLPFVYYNLPNAKLFMGDSGSLPIGFLIALALFFIEGEWKGDLSLAPLFLPVFWIDGFYTIANRLLKRQNILEAHREHLFQRIQSGFLSKKETLVVFLFQNLLPSIFFISYASGYINNFFIMYLYVFLVSHAFYFILNYMLEKKIALKKYVTRNF